MKEVPGSIGYCILYGTLQHLDGLFDVGKFGAESGAKCDSHPIKSRTFLGLCGLTPANSWVYYVTPTAALSNRCGGFMLLRVVWCCISACLLISFCFAFSAIADPVPSLVWTGDPTGGGVFPDCQDGGGTTPEATTNGIDTMAFCLGSAGFNGGEFIVDRTFTVTSPGDFLLSTSVLLSGTGANCYPLGCFSSAQVEVSEGGVTELFLGSVYSGAGPVGGLSGPSLSGSSTTNCGSSLVCETFLGLYPNPIVGNESEVVYLGLGDYTLEQDYTLFEDGIEPSGGGDFNTCLVTGSLPSSCVFPTPEPRWQIFISLAPFIAGIVTRLRSCTRARMRLLLRRAELCGEMSRQY